VGTGAPAVEQEPEVRPHRGPFAVDDAVYDGVAPAAVGHQLVIAQHAILFGAEPLRAIALMENDPVFGTDRLTSGLLAFPEGRQLAFTCSTQLSLTQKVTVLGTRGRLEIPIPFNAPADQQTVLIFDDGRDLAGGGRQEIVIEPVDQYREQVDAFAEAVLSGTPLETGLDDAIANMKAIDALFRSASSGRWEDA